MARRGFLASRPMEILSFVLLAFAMATSPARSQSTDILGFISIDCGIPPNQVYVEPITNITYVSDVGFTDTGKNMNISGAYADKTGRRGLTVRSFPDGARNCYTVKATAGTKYLVRAVFLYGNYDGLNTQPYLFELHLGVNLWTTINITDPQLPVMPEVITVVTADFVSVCLVNIGAGTPFISALELRPLKDIMYPAVNASRSLVLKFRFNLGPTYNVYRYPDDRHDRMWHPLNNIPFWKEINTTDAIQVLDTDHFEAPSVVMQTAVVPVNSTKLQIYWAFEAGDINEYFCILYFAEIVKFTGNTSRQFYVKINDQLWYGKPFTPQYLYNNYIYEVNPNTGYLQYTLSLEALGNSTLPPILNAMEVYTTMRNSSVPSDNGDVGAMVAIKAWYQIKRNWNGDPCSPKAFAWDGLNCTYSVSTSPRVTTLNLSSSNLTGQLTGSFGNLIEIQYLDLSYNNLTGPIPDSLAGLEALKVLDLRGNRLNGSIPSALLAKSQKGFITLRIEGNPNLCDNESSCDVTAISSKKKISTPAIVIICIVAVVLLLVLLFVFLRVMKISEGNGTSMKPQNDAILRSLRGQQDDTLQLENIQFTHLELQKITNNFERQLGQGGFGKVYYGCLADGTQVAVKMRSNSSVQGNKEFLAEAKHLTRVHHKNLVSLVGYCTEGEYLGLVYEFMSQGTLHGQLIAGRTSSARPLDWRQRLRISVESAQGLEYLHKDCRPPLVHRDVKTANILLSEKLEAKIADFGLSRAFHADANPHMTTAVMGTPGYVDPERFISNQLNEKSDVYSFGVVLLELITGRPAILPDNTSLVEWVSRRLARGSIDDVVDFKMQGTYDINSVWKCADVALECTSQSSQQRPSMSDVVERLKESWELETANDTNEIPFTGSQNLQSEVSDASGSNGAVEIDHGAILSAVSGPSAR